MSDTNWLLNSRCRRGYGVCTRQNDFVRFIRENSRARHCYRTDYYRCEYIQTRVVVTCRLVFIFWLGFFFYR